MASGIGAHAAAIWTRLHSRRRLFPARRELRRSALGRGLAGRSARNPCAMTTCRRCCHVVRQLRHHSCRRDRDRAALSAPRGAGQGEARPAAVERHHRTRFLAAPPYFFQGSSTRRTMKSCSTQTIATRARQLRAAIRPHTGPEIHRPGVRQPFHSRAHSRPLPRDRTPDSAHRGGQSVRHDPRTRARRARYTATRRRNCTSPAEASRWRWRMPARRSMR